MCITLPTQHVMPKRDKADVHYIREATVAVMRFEAFDAGSCDHYH